MRCFYQPRTPYPVTMLVTRLFDLLQSAAMKGGCKS